jgi:hypothetical protein
MLRRAAFHSYHRSLNWNPEDVVPNRWYSAHLLRICMIAIFRRISQFNVTNSAASRGSMNRRPHARGPWAVAMTPAGLPRPRRSRADEGHGHADPSGITASDRRCRHGCYRLAIWRPCGRRACASPSPGAGRGAYGVGIGHGGHRPPAVPLSQPMPAFRGSAAGQAFRTAAAATHPSAIVIPIPTVGCLQRP